MRLLLIRHAIAEERGARWPDDSLRPLTDEGERKMQEAAAGIAHLLQPGVILTSPFARASRTAEIVAARFPGVAVQEEAALTGPDYSSWFATTGGTGMACVAVVGHEPLLSEALSVLLCGDEGAVRTEFKKGAAALVECGDAPGPGTGTLLWLIQPAGLRAIGRGSTD